jgi:hypothetical protein
MKIEFKKVVLFVFEKEKRKKRKPYLLTFQPAAAHRPISLPPTVAQLPASFSFFSEPLTRGPPVGTSFFFPQRPFLPLFQAGSTAVDPAAPARTPSPPLPFHRHK